MAIRIAAIGLLLLTTANAYAQHHHDSYDGHHRSHVPYHSGVHYGHTDWHHVVPHHSAYEGAYYTVDSSHYYTPSPVTRVVPGEAPPPVEVRKPIELTFGGYARQEDLSGRLAFEANLLCLELHYNYRHNERFAEAYREAYAVLEAAKFLQAKRDRADIRQRVVEVDKLFHHFQDETRGWTRTTAKRIGAGALPEKGAAVEALLHHICFDVGVKPHEQPSGDVPPEGDTNETAPPPPGK